MYTVINKIAQDQGFSKEGFRIIVNCGEHGRQEVDHIHFHILGGEQLGQKICKICKDG